MFKVYQAKVKKKELLVDEYQEKVASALDDLNQRIASYSPPQPGFFEKVSTRNVLSVFAH